MKNIDSFVEKLNFKNALYILFIALGIVFLLNMTSKSPVIQYIRDRINMEEAVYKDAIGSGEGIIVASHRGDVRLMRTPGDGGWVKVKEGARISEGDVVMTGKDGGLNLIVFVEKGNPDSIVEVEVYNNSHVMFPALARKDGGLFKTIMDVALGKVHVNARKVNTKRSIFEIKTPTSIVNAKDAECLVDVKADD